MSPPLIRIAQRHRAKTRAAEPKSPSNHNGVNLFPSCLVIPFVLKQPKDLSNRDPLTFRGVNGGWAEWAIAQPGFGRIEYYFNFFLLFCEQH